MGIIGTYSALLGCPDSLGSALWEHWIPPGMARVLSHLPGGPQDVPGPPKYPQTPAFSPKERVCWPCVWCALQVKAGTLKKELKRRTRDRKLLQCHPLLLVQLWVCLVAFVAEATRGASAASAPGHPCQ